MGEQEYVIKSYRKGEGISHNYEVAPCEDVKNIWRTMKVTETNFGKFEHIIKGVQKVIDEMNSITKAHEERMEKNKDINRLETKLIVIQESYKEEKSK